jgi:ribonuclease R
MANRRERVLGRFERRGAGGFVVPFDGLPKEGVRVPGAFVMGARDADVVEVEILRPAAGGRSAEGKVLDVLGPFGAPGVDGLVVARKYGLPLEFPDAVVEAARRLPRSIPREELARRELFENPPPVTVDGETARDFDDAIAVEERPDGGFRLFVHVADVSWYVRRDGLLDREAAGRATSVYFPERVLPMLPEVVSNELGSLRPRQWRLVQTAILELDRTGRVERARFRDGAIRSAARLTYAQVCRVLEGGDLPGGVPRSVLPMLRLANRVRALLEERRRERGSVDFDLPEPEILLDVDGLLTGVVLSPRNDAHRMIEEFMIAANEAVARTLVAAKAPCLFRVHEPPDPEKIEALREFCRRIGVAFDGDPNRIHPRDLQRLLERAETRPEYPVLAQVVLRSMKQARYATDNIGHFGLASEAYTHFTSPIRRYADLVVHRILRAVRHRRQAAIETLARGLEEVADRCSRLERQAESAEREILAWKKIAFMKGKEGERFEGLVTGVAPFGLFVQFSQGLVEGLLHVEGLGKDSWEYSPSRQELRGRRSGRLFRLGDRLRVQVLRVDPVRRHVDLGLDRPVAAVLSKRRGRTGRAHR